MMPPYTPGDDAYGHVARTCTYFHVRKATRVLADCFDDALRPHGLKGTQFSLLTALRLSDGSTLGHLASVMGMDRTTLTRNLAPLEREGLVERRPGQDRRQRRLRLTPAGAQRLDDAFDAWRSTQEAIRDRLGNEAWHALMSGTQAVHALAGEEKRP